MIPLIRSRGCWRPYKGTSVRASVSGLRSESLRSNNRLKIQETALSHSCSFYHVDQSLCFFYSEIQYSAFNLTCVVERSTSMSIRSNLDFNYIAAPIGQVHLTFLFLPTIALKPPSNDQVISSLTSTRNLHNDGGESPCSSKKSSRTGLQTFRFLACLCSDFDYRCEENLLSYTSCNQILAPLFLVLL